MVKINKGIALSMALAMGVGFVSPSIANASEVKNVKEVQAISSVGSVRDGISLYSSALIPYSSIENYFMNAKHQVVHATVNKAINTKEDLEFIMNNMYRELPDTLTFKTNMSDSTIQSWYNEYMSTTTSGMVMNIYTLAKYDLTRVGQTYTFTDTSNIKYSAKAIESGIKAFAKDFATKISGLSYNNKVKAIYDYIYENFRYENYNRKEMMVGNAYRGYMACEGFSRLFYELANASGVENRIVSGDGHVYNHIKDTTGKWIILDVTSDMLRKNKHGATGLEISYYLGYVYGLHYSAKPLPGQPSASYWTDSEKANFLR